MAKVGFITDSFSKDGEMFEGGAERHLFQLVRLARDLGAEATIYQPHRRAEEWTIAGLRVIGSPSVGGVWRSNTRRAISDGCTHLHFQYLERVPRGLPTTKVTATAHAVYWDVPYDRALASWYPYGALARWYLPAWRFRAKRMAFTSLRRCNDVLCGDSSLLRVVQAESPHLRDRLHVVTNFSDLPTRVAGAVTSCPTHLQPIQDAKRAGRLLVLIPRNLSLARGLAWLPDIARRLTEKFGHAFLMVVTGRFVDVYGRANQYRRLSSNATYLGDLADRILVLGGVARGDVEWLYDASDVVLIPTFFHEGGSLAAIEAMSRGKPVVATNVGGLNDVIIDEYTGLLVRPTPDNIAAAIVRVATNAMDRGLLSSRAAAVARDRFTLDHWRRRVVPFVERNGWLE